MEVKKRKMKTKIIVALVIGIALIGLTGVASASMFDDFYSGFNSYSYESVDHSSLNIVRSYTPSLSIAKPYISTYTSISSVFEVYEPTDTTSPSVYEPYSSGNLAVSYFGSNNGETISGSVIDSTSPYYIAESIPFGTGTFSFSAFASYWP
jgi:hypothetical protein